MTHPTHPSLRKPLPLILAYLLFLLALSVDIVLLNDVGLLAEAPPIFDMIYLLRSALIALSSGMLVFGIAWGWPSQVSSGTSRAAKGQEPGQWFAEHDGDFFSDKTKTIFIWGLLALATSFLILFLVDARAYHHLGKEDNLIEFISALAWFCSGLVFFRMSYVLYRIEGKVRSLYFLILLLLTLVCFFVSMEEISWFQRVFELDTPDFIVENAREEINFHNYATDEVENVYYFSTFLAFIFFPFILSRIKSAQASPLIRLFTPSSSVLLASSIAVAYNYDMWNILFTQLSFFITLFILMVKAWLVRRAGGVPITLVALIVILGLTQALFLIHGSTFIRIWDVTEYKEFFIPLGIVLYSLDVYHRIRSKDRIFQPAEAFHNSRSTLSTHR